MQKCVWIGVYLLLPFPYILAILGLSLEPVLQILQVVDERLVLKKSTLGKDWQGISMVICLLESKGSAEGKQV